MAHYRYAYELVQRQGVCMDATVMTSCSLDAEFDFCCGPWPTSHSSMGPGPCVDANPFSPKAKGPSPPEVTADASSMFMLSIGASPAPPSGPFPFSNPNGGSNEEMGDVTAVRYRLWCKQLSLDFYNFKDFYFFKDVLH